jgi:hypothetical protein
MRPPSSTYAAHAGRRDRLQRGRQPLHHHRRQAERELVDQDHLRTGDERLRQHDHLLLAAREQPRAPAPGGAA